MGYKGCTLLHGPVYTLMTTLSMSANKICLLIFKWMFHFWNLNNTSVSALHHRCYNYTLSTQWMQVYYLSYNRPLFPLTTTTINRALMPGITSTRMTQQSLNSICLFVLQYEARSEQAMSDYLTTLRWTKIENVWYVWMILIIWV